MVPLVLVYHFNMRPPWAAGTPEANEACTDQGTLKGGEHPCRCCLRDVQGGASKRPPEALLTAGTQH